MNYHTCATSMRMASLSKNKLKFIDDMYRERYNTMVLSWILIFMSDNIGSSVLWFDTSIDVRKDLEARFVQSDFFRISNLQEEIYSFKKGTLSVSEYYTYMKLLWDEFANLRPIPKCKCEP